MHSSPDRSIHPDGTAGGSEDSGATVVLLGNENIFPMFFILPFE